MTSRYVCLVRETGVLLSQPDLAHKLCFAPYEALHQRIIFSSEILRGLVFVVLVLSSFNPANWRSKSVVANSRGSGLISLLSEAYLPRYLTTSGGATLPECATFQITISQIGEDLRLSLIKNEKLLSGSCNSHIGQSSILFC